MGRVRRLRHTVLAIAVAVVAVVVFARPPLAQDLAYHHMADHRACWMISNCLNVVSNLPFALVGWLGLAMVVRPGNGRATPFADAWERWPYVVLFGGTALTALGSAYYHLAPDNARLVWDRLPMTLGFMGLLAALVAERVSLRVARVLLWPLVVFGIVSVGYWYWSEVQGRGDLRLYILVQFGSLVLVLLLPILYPARDLGTGYLFTGLGAYAAAKVLEATDAPVFALGGIVSGHTLKHLAAAGAAACLVAMLRARMARGGAARLPDQRRDRPLRATTAGSRLDT